MKLAAFAVALIGALFTTARVEGSDAWQGVPVLMYHKVDAITPPDAVGRSLTLAPAAFEAQLAWLRTHRIATMTTQELTEAMRRGKRPTNAVVLTFDDGYEDAYVDVLPLLREYGAKASFYVSADLVGSPRHLSWKELREMRAAGMEIGCHGSRHLDLTTLNRAEKQYEIGHCASALTRWLGESPKTYAYAAGQYDTKTLEVIRRFGFKAALTEHNGVVTERSRVLELPRRRVDRGDTIETFARSAVP